MPFLCLFSMRFFIVFLLALSAYFVYELYSSDSGYERSQQLEAQINEQTVANQAALERNKAMMAEIQDLREGGDAIEEMVRFEQGMTQADELFVQISTPN